MSDHTTIDDDFELTHRQRNAELLSSHPPVSDNGVSDIANHPPSQPNEARVYEFA